MLATLLSTLIAVQDPKPSDPPDTKPQAEVAAAPKPAVPWNDKEAKAAVDEFAKAMKPGASMADKNRALESLAQGSNKLLVKPLASVVETDKSVVIRKRAAEILAMQPAADANPAILRLLKSSKVDQPTVQASLVQALANCAYNRSQWKEIADLFEREYSAERVPLQEALLDLIERHKEKQAVDLLLRNMDEPKPENVDDAANPPAEYWEARWKSWRAWRGKVKDAMFALTGQRFSTASEAKAWLRKNQLK